MLKVDVPGDRGNPTEVTGAGKEEGEVAGAGVLWLKEALELI